MHGGVSSRCYFHPKEEVVGVCALCLNERLLILAAKQAASSSSSSRSSKLFSSSLNATPSAMICSRSRNNKDNNTHNLSSLFGLGRVFSSRDKSARPCYRCKAKEEKEDVLFDDDHNSTSTSLDDESFISIKIGDNGVASWDKSSNRVSKVSLQHCSMSWGWGGRNSVNNSSRKSVMEHAKPGFVSSLRWRKRIAQLLEVLRWKESSRKAGNIKVETLKMRNHRGWLPTLSLRSPPTNDPKMTSHYKMTTRCRGFTNK